MFTPSISVDESASRFIKKLRKVNDEISNELIVRAYRFSWFAHKGQTRESGDPFLAHAVAVGLILAGQNLDEITVAAGLLHDVVEDTEVTVEDIREEFGEEISLLVDGVTKIKSFHISSRKQMQAETYRKMLLSMARDLRVIIIKFADRIHNLRTLKYLKPEKVQQIAQETLDIYAPLAHRLGMARIKSELEDLAFKYLHPEDYDSIVSKITENRHKRERIIDSFAIPVRKELENQMVKATIIGRPKNFYSIYRKMVERNRSFDEIYDLLAIRILTDSVMDCYLVLGIVHSLWRPIQDRFKDYISLPKANGYQSLHTTVMGNDGKIVEIQIRTWEMNQTAEDGIAAHWLYKSGGEIAIRERDRAISWLRNLIEWQKGMTDSAEFMEFFKVDLFHTEIFVYTPKGDLITLAKGSTVLDF
ncbi:MAG: RelA/SpoT family protein, partial [Chitinivibrionales bacterium]